MIFGDNWSKYDSLEFLKEMGYNTPEFLLITSSKELAKVIDDWGTFNKLSIRSFRPRSNLTFNEPFYPNIEMNDVFINIMNGHLRQGYHLIISKGIDPTGTKWKGNIMIYPSFSMRRFDYILECSEGYGTVRDLEKDKNIKCFTSILEAMQATKCPEMSKIYIVAKDIFDKLDKKPIILEWSVYEFPVGIKNKTVIYWEVRKGYERDVV